MKEFSEWVHNNGMTFPVPEEEFHWLMGKYAVEDMGRLTSGKLGFMDNKVVMLRVGFMFQGFKNMNATEANDFYERIEGLVGDLNSNSSAGL